MSLNLYWAPVTTTQLALPDALKFVLRERFGDGIAVRRHFSYDDIPYLQGLLDANVAGAKDLIEAIEKHGTVIVFTE